MTPRFSMFELMLIAVLLLGLFVAGFFMGFGDERLRCNFIYWPG